MGGPTTPAGGVVPRSRSTPIGRSSQPHFTPIGGFYKSRPPARGWRKQLSRSLTRLSLSPLHRIEESVVSESNSFPLESTLPQNPSFDVPENRSIGGNSSHQSYYTANTSSISTDSSLYHTADASVSTLSSIHSTSSQSSDVSLPYSVKSVNSHKSLKTVLYRRPSIHSTSTQSSDVSLPYSVKSVNSHKSLKTVLYRRRKHPPPVAISSQVRLILLSLAPNTDFLAGNFRAPTTRVTR